MCSPSMPDPPDPAAKASAVGKSAAGSLENIDEAKQAQAADQASAGTGANMNSYINSIFGIQSNKAKGEKVEHPLGRFAQFAKQFQIGG